jgi:hypothetical protein
MRQSGRISLGTFLILIIAGAIAVNHIGGCEKKPPRAPSASTPSQSPPATTAMVRSAWPFLDASAPAKAGGGEFDPATMMTRNYYFILDASGSMNDQKCSGNEPKIAVAKRALEQFVRDVPADANLGGLVFDKQGVYEVLPLARRDAGKFERAIAPVHAGGGTPLAQAIRGAYGALTRQAMTQLGYGEYHMVVVTDGEATGEDPRGAVDLLVSQSPVVLHTIGFCIGSSHSLNQPGRTIYSAADSPEQLTKGLADVLAESATFHVAKFKK